VKVEQQPPAPADDVRATPSRAPTPLTIRPPPKVKVSIHGAKASRIVAEGSLVTTDSFEHAPGQVQLSWQCPGTKKKPAPSTHSRILEVPARGPMSVELPCPP
jgi:hypothetical protein